METSASLAAHLASNCDSTSRWSAFLPPTLKLRGRDPLHARSCPNGLLLLVASLVPPCLAL